jgi:RNA polymerase sigma-70 factor (ECF subfamily)
MKSMSLPRPASPTETDADVIRRSLTDGEAFAPVFDRHYSAVYGYTARRAGIDAGEEIAAEVFVRAFDQRHRYDQTYVDARPWLLGIATNLLRKRWRADRRRLAALARVRASSSALPPDASLGRDAIEAVATLPPRDREALLLYAWAGFAYEDIGRALGIPVGTVRSRIARSRAALRSRLAPQPATNLSILKEPNNG